MAIFTGLDAFLTELALLMKIFAIAGTIVFAYGGLIKE